MQQRQNLILHYNLQKRKVTGHKISIDSLEQIKNLQPSQINEQDLTSPWIKFVNDKYTSRQLRNANGHFGKWILQFPAGSEELDKAWKILVDGVANGTLWEAKISPRNNKFANQVICIYTIDRDDLDDIERTYDYLDSNGLIKAHLAQSINNDIVRYKTDEQTLKHQGDASLLTHKEILKRKQERQERASQINQATKNFKEINIQFNKLAAQIDTTAHCYSFFYSTKYSNNTLSEIDKLKKQFIQELENLPPSLRRTNEIKHYLESPVIDFHKSRTPIFRIGNTRTRRKIEELMALQPEEKRLLKTLGRQG